MTDKQRKPPTVLLGAFCRSVLQDPAATSENSLIGILNQLNVTVPADLEGGNPENISLQQFAAFVSLRLAEPHPEKEIGKTHITVDIYSSTLTQFPKVTAAFENLKIEKGQEFLGLTLRMDGILFPIPMIARRHEIFARWKLDDKLLHLMKIDLVVKFQEGTNP